MRYTFSAALFSGSLEEPTGGAALTQAVEWSAALLTGTLATIVAIIAVAFVGSLMLTGRANLRLGGSVVLGCFILFGAPLVASGLRAVAIGTSTDQENLPHPIGLAPPATIPPKQSQVVDPHEGASLPSTG